MKNQKRRLNKLRRVWLKNWEVVMDDESYFTCSNSAFSGNRGFYSSSKELTPPVAKYAGIKKFPRTACGMGGNIGERFQKNSHYRSRYGGPTCTFGHPQEKFEEVY